MNLGALLTRNIGGLPAWAWGGIVIGGGLAVWYFFRRQSGGPGALGQNAAGQQSNVDTSQIDPNTGVPYSIEEATNPATGLPAYYGGPGVDATTTPAPAPGPNPNATPPGPTPAPNTPPRPEIVPKPYVTKPPVAGPPGPKPKPKPKPRRRPPRGRRGDGPDEGSGDGPDSEGSGSGPDSGACPFGLNCTGGCAGHCQTQATPFWPVMTDVSGGRY